MGFLDFCYRHAKPRLLTKNLLSGQCKHWQVTRKPAKICHAAPAIIFTLFFIYFSSTPQGHLPWTGVDNQRVHARGDHHWPQVAVRVCVVLLPLCWPDQAEPTQEAAETGAAVQQIRGAQLLAYIAPETQEKLRDMTRWPAGLKCLDSQDWSCFATDMTIPTCGIYLTRD